MKTVVNGVEYANIEGTNTISGRKRHGIVPHELTKENWGLNGVYKDFCLIKDDVMLKVSSEDGIINGRDQMRGQEAPLMPFPSIIR